MVTGPRPDKRRESSERGQQSLILDLSKEKTGVSGSHVPEAAAAGRRGGDGPSAGLPHLGARDGAGSVWGPVGPG